MLWRNSFECNINVVTKPLERSTGMPTLGWFLGLSLSHLEKAMRSHWFSRKDLLESSLNDMGLGKEFHLDSGWY